MIVAGNGIYEFCRDCGHYVKMNKWLFGSAHFCITSEERAARAAQAASYQTRSQMMPKQNYGLISPLFNGIYSTKEANMASRAQQDAVATFNASIRELGGGIV